MTTLYTHMAQNTMRTVARCSACKAWRELWIDTPGHPGALFILCTQSTCNKVEITRAAIRQREIKGACKT